MSGYEWNSFFLKDCMWGVISCIVLFCYFSFFIYFYLVVVGDSDRNYHNNQILYLNSVNLL